MTSRRFAEKTTRHIRVLSNSSQAIKTMYMYSAEHETRSVDSEIDLLNEKKHTTEKGVVCKYPGRALMLLSYTCAANCRYCERQDRVGVGLDAEGRLTPDAVRRAVTHILARPDITEIIFSGGDPLTNPRGLLLASQLLAEAEHVEILRIHTRFPLQMPSKVDFGLMEELVVLRPVYYLSLHIDHPDELTPEVVQVVRRLRKIGFVMLSQSVFLKGVNDNASILASMFQRLAALGVRPYYIYHCQSIATTDRFIMKIEDEIRIMTQLREMLSGLAFPQHVIDMPGTTGKVIIPTSHIDFDLGRVRDFLGRFHSFSSPADR